MSTPIHSNRTVLVVEDDDGLLNLIAEVLRNAGFAVTTANQGQLALDAVTQQRFDVLITDITLPDMNGMIIGDTARDLYQNQIVIIVMTGENIDSRKLASLGLYADDFLRKPFDMQELIARIESKLRRMDTQ